jgi:rhodanese-related sulfurtransferase
MFDDGKRIYEAIKIDFSMSKEKIVSLLPDKKRLIIIYCGGYECPAGAMLARKLLSMGYKNVIDYPGGINEWKNIKQNRK